MRIRDVKKHRDPDPEHWQKVIKKSQNRRNQGFSYYFRMMMEGSGSGCGSGSPKNYGSNGSGSGSATLLRWEFFFEFLKASIADLITLFSSSVQNSEGGGDGIVCNSVWLLN
jgi:hypothetical protein